MGLCATKKKYLDDEHDGEEGEGIDEEALRESISHIDEFSHVLYANEEDMLKCFDFQNAKILSSGEKTDVYYVKYQQNYYTSQAVYLVYMEYHMEKY